MKYAVGVVALAGVAAARKCQDIFVTVQASARNGVFNVPTPVTDIDVTNFILDLTQQGTNYSAATLEGYKTVSGTFKLATTYCVPDRGDPSTVQLLTHGIGFDRSYWNPTFNNFNYSYVAEAVDEFGYATLAWDRLGIGMSSHGEPVNEIQALLEVDALRALTMDLRNGKIPGVEKSYEKVLHVGHSFGSEHTYALTAMYPNISDGIALTGFSQNGSFIPFFGLGGNFIQANSVPAGHNYSDGYLAAADASAVQTNFFAPNTFDPKILQFAFTTGQPVTVGELLTIGGETGSINKFAGPTLIITGARDIPYCGGNCLAAPTGFSSIPAAALKTLPDAKKPEVVIVPKTGHGLNYAYSHPFTFSTINKYFINSGVGPNGGGQW